MRPSIDRKILITLAALAAFAAGACSTIAGAGRDLQGAGRAVTHAAERTQDHMNN